ncbi:MAG TPA: hypothetical protein VFQ57_00715 [Sphingomonas sp.]|jgi:protein TonB|nr:hypothetical protein [Sphingomonas sp.]
MRSAFQNPASKRRRVTSFALTIAAHLLILLLLLKLGPSPIRLPDSDPSLVTFNATGDKQAPRAAVVKVARASKAASRGGAPRAAPTTPVPAPPADEAPLALFGDKALYAASDISKLPTREADAGSGGGTGADEGAGDSLAAYGPGAGPGGAKLYKAEWFRRPTDAELNGYLRSGPPPTGSWALIACKTIDDNRVENCRSLGESPVGSGLARAMREAAWQFRIRPPRIDGRPVLGAWVSIKIDFTLTAR